jgi:glutamyl-tRNA synthetase
MTNSPDTPTAEPRPVRVRFAPSPTGSLHVGGGRTALFNYLFAHGEARRQGMEGAFVIRIEDTDRNRFVEGATEGIFAILAWFGLEWDEGPDRHGPHGPYTQSERTALYRQHAELLIERGHAYRCFCSPERLAKVREEQTARKLPPGYDRHCRDLPAEMVAANLAAAMPYVIRFRTPLEGETRVQDMIRGEIVYQNSTLEDLVLLKSDGYPTYHLANVVDDHLMAISHILRGEEWIPTAPLHVLLYGAFGWEAPVFCHQPLILAPTGGKLSKRHGHAAMEEYRAAGYLPEALMNYLALLGWSYDGQREVFSRQDLLELFALEKVNPSPAKFDYDKLLWFNQHYINHILPLEDLTARLIPFLVAAGLVEPGAAEPSHPGHTLVRETTALYKDRLTTLLEATDLFRPFLLDELDPYDPALLVPKKGDPLATIEALLAAEQAIGEIDLNDETASEARCRALADDLGLKAGQLFMPIRVAVTGRTQTPGLFGTLRVIGAARCRARLLAAVERLRAIGDESISADD